MSHAATTACRGSTARRGGVEWILGDVGPRDDVVQLRNSTSVNSVCPRGQHQTSHDASLLLLYSRMKTNTSPRARNGVTSYPRICRAGASHMAAPLAPHLIALGACAALVTPGPAWNSLEAPTLALRDV